VLLACCRPPSEAEEEAWKILLVGDEQVGKTCLARRFHGGADAGGAAAGGFAEALPPTFSVDFVAATVETPGGQARALHVYDSPGRADFTHGMRYYYRGMHGVMVVFDLTSAESFKGAARWVEEVDAHCGEEQGARQARRCQDTRNPPRGVL
jgi:small GTP-binding protein